MSPTSYQTAPPRDVFLWRAGNGTRTRDPNLGKVVLYQLSYSRVERTIGEAAARGKRDRRVVTRWTSHRMIGRAIQWSPYRLPC